MSTPTTPRAVLRFAKVRSLRGLAGASAHNMRTAAAGIAHADGHAPQMGGGVRLLAGDRDAVAAWQATATERGIRPARRDAVIAVEAVLSASPRWFAQASPTEREAWAARSVAWATEALGGPANVLQATLHDDEQTPHIHLLAIPAVLKTRRARGRAGRAGRAESAPCWGLSAADIIGSPEQLVAHQTAYAEAVAGLGIERGEPRRVSGARHQSAHAYRAVAARVKGESDRLFTAAARAWNEGSASLAAGAQKVKEVYERVKGREAAVAARERAVGEREAAVALESATALRLVARVKDAEAAALARRLAEQRAMRSQRSTAPQR